MGQDTVSFPHGSRLEAVFATADEKIRSLAGFITDAAADLQRGTSLAAAVRSAASHHSFALEAFNLEDDDASIEQGFALNDKLTFPNEPLPATIRFERHNTTTLLALDAMLAHDLHFLLAMCGTGRSTAEQIRDAIDEPMLGLFERLLDNGIVVEQTLPPPLPQRMVQGPCVTRLQHAGLLYRGRSAGVLVDPHFHSSYEPNDLGGNFLRCQFEGLVDAIVISHSHRDHWHLPTLLSFSPDTLIVVPRTFPATMLCPDFAATLRSFGFQRVVELGWYDPPVVVGDLEVHALPFYGEQPLLHERPRHPDLRNHGNTYVIRTDSYTSWFLIDSGSDWSGCMTQVAHEVKTRFGHVDLLLSNLREFALYHPLYISGGHYWLSLTPDQLRRFTAMAKDVITLGPRGVAEICHIVQAREVAGYAHWWGEIGESPDPREGPLTEQLRSHLAGFGAATKILPWTIGDTYLR